MPSKNRTKQYVNGDYYHVYNRGVERRLTFLDAQDYLVFIDILKLYLVPPNIGTKNHLDLSGDIELAAFCLMPNHFHLLIKQIEDKGMERFMRCLIVRYVAYFNRKYDRVGCLFQDSYKAVRITDNDQLFQAEQYIHLNPQMLINNVENYPYSSLGVIGDSSWMRPAPIEGRTRGRFVPRVGSDPNVVLQAEGYR